MISIEIYYQIKKKIQNFISCIPHMAPRIGRGKRWRMEVHKLFLAQQMEGGKSLWQQPLCHYFLLIYLFVIIIRLLMSIVQRAFIELEMWGACEVHPCVWNASSTSLNSFYKGTSSSTNMIFFHLIHMCLVTHKISWHYIFWQKKINNVNMFHECKEMRDVRLLY